MEHKQMCFLAKNVSETVMEVCARSWSSLFPVYSTEYFTAMKYGTVLAYFAPWKERWIK